MCNIQVIFLRHYSMCYIFKLIHFSEIISLWMTLIFETYAFQVHLTSWYPLICSRRMTICLLKVESHMYTNILKKLALRHWNPPECGYPFQMNSERKIPLWWEFHSAATSFSLYQGRAFEKGVCIFEGRPHSSLLAVVGPAEDKNLSCNHYSKPSCTTPSHSLQLGGRHWWNNRKNS